MYNPFAAHIVAFADNTYAIRRWRLGYCYLDNNVISQDPKYWWSTYDSAMKYTKFDSLQDCQKRLQEYKHDTRDWGTPV